MFSFDDEFLKRLQDGATERAASQMSVAVMLSLVPGFKVIENNRLLVGDLLFGFATPSGAMFSGGGTYDREATEPYLYCAASEETLALPAELRSVLSLYKCLLRLSDKASSLPYEVNKGLYEARAAVVYLWPDVYLIVGDE